MASLCLLSAHTDANVEQIVSIAADINGDGIIHFPSDEKKTIPADLSAAEKPFLFWLNDDQDNIALYESWPHDEPDLSNETIGSPRDMEDFARLHVKLGGTIDTQSEFLEFAFLATSGVPEIQLWLSEDKEGRRGYVLDESMALAQIESASQSLGKVSPEKTLRIPIDSQLLQRVHNDRLSFLFEGVSEGQGALTVRIISNNGDPQIASSPLYIGLRPIKTFYERIGIDWPKDIKAPWKYKFSQPPQPNLIWKAEEMEHPFRRPWYEDHNVIVWVHGWIPQDDENYRRTLVFSFETMLKRLWHQGYRGRIVHFRWPTLKKRNFIGMQESEYRAYKSALVLVNYVNNLPKDKRVHTTAHSLGGSLLMEAVKLGLDSESAVFQVSAVPAESLDKRESLRLSEKMKGSDQALDVSFSGYAEASKTRIYNLYNPKDFTWFGWNLIQNVAKPFQSWTHRYIIREHAEPSRQVKLKSWLFFSRPVLDHHEIMALAVSANSQALGGEGRVQGAVDASYNINLPPYNFETDHVAMWRWNPQKVMPYFNLLLDSFNLPYNSLEP
ncbi:MAG: alpha/beta hydrolase [Cellvibrionaceae bacterium]